MLCGRLAHAISLVLAPVKRVVRPLVYSGERLVKALVEKPMLRANHFPLKSDIRVMQSCYRHSKPHSYCGYLRSEGWDPVREAGQVVVYHLPGTEPDEKLQPISRQVLSAGDHHEQYRRGINALIDQLLRGSGFIRIGPRERREYISPSEHVRSLVVAQRGPHLPSLNIQAHLRWTWELEWSEGSFWLVPLPGRRFLTAQEPRFPSLDRWLRVRVTDNERIKGIDLNTGRHPTLTLRGGQWGMETRGAWESLDGDGWRVCLDMEPLEELGCSGEAFRSAQFSFDGVHAALRQSSPFGRLITTTDPHTPAEARAGIVSGTHLRFRKGTARDLKEVHQLGILEHPPLPVRLLVVASQKDSSEQDQLARHILNAHLAVRSSLRGEKGEEALRSVGASDGRDTIATIWTSGKYRRGFELPPFSLAQTKLHLYDAATGELLAAHALEQEAELADREGVALIALVLLDEDMAKPEHDRLMRQFRRMKALPLRASTLTGGSGAFAAWVNLTLYLAQKAGAVPWDLADLPGVDEQTVFVGIDLGHDHARDRSRIAFTLFDHRGRPVDNHVVPRGRNDERIPSDVLHDDLPRFIFNRVGEAPTQVIVHRDGRYLAGEADDLTDALRDVPRLTFVSIKKNTCTRLAGQQLEGAFFEFDERRTVLVTNTQSQHSSMPAPIEVELVHSDRLSIRQVVSQVFWLTRVCQGNANFPKRLPTTTDWANNIAGTGYRVHLKGWEYL